MGVVVVGKRLHEMKLAMDIRQSVQRILLGAGLITFAYMVVFFVSFYRPANVPPDSLIGSQPTLRIAPALAIGLSTTMLILFRVGFARTWAARARGGVCSYWARAQPGARWPRNC